MGRFFKNGTLEQEVVSAYGSPDMVVLALIRDERTSKSAVCLAALGIARDSGLSQGRDGLAAGASTRRSSGGRDHPGAGSSPRPQLRLMPLRAACPLCRPQPRPIL